MSGDPIPSAVDIRSQSVRGLRWQQVRSTAVVDQSFDIHTTYATSVDLVVVANAVWSEAIHVAPFDQITLLVNFTKGSIAGSGGFDIQVQTGPTANGPWYERHASFDLREGTTPVIPQAANILTWRAAADAAVAFDLRAIGYFMRFRPGGVAGSGSLGNSRISISGIRETIST